MINDKFEFIRYDAADANDKHLGIATIKIHNKFLVRVKEIYAKNGTHTFLASPSVKIGEKFCSAFEIDSKSEQEEFDKFVRHHIAEFKKKLYRPQQQQAYSENNIPF